MTYLVRKTVNNKLTGRITSDIALHIHYIREQSQSLVITESHHSGTLMMSVLINRFFLAGDIITRINRPLTTCLSNGRCTSVLQYNSLNTRAQAIVTQSKLGEMYGIYLNSLKPSQTLIM